MPAKVKATKEMIVDAAFEVARERGAENINARTVSERLNCSTQPVMYHFATIEELKKAVYKKADEFHSEYLMNIKSPMRDTAITVSSISNTLPHFSEYNTEKCGIINIIRL